MSWILLDIGMTQAQHPWAWYDWPVERARDALTWALVRRGPASQGSLAALTGWGLVRHTNSFMKSWSEAKLKALRKGAPPRTRELDYLERKHA